MGADTPEIAVGTVDGGLYLGLLGRATQRTCPTADRLVNDYLASRPQKPLIVVDLGGCEWVDSTFAGWLVALCGDVQQMPGLGPKPSALNIDIDAEGRTVGLF